jgi:hypothetical protein
MLSRLECCETCTLQDFAGDGTVLPFGNYDVASQILVLRDRTQLVEDSPNSDTSLTAKQRLGARVCAAVIDSGECPAYSVIEVKKKVIGRKYLALLTKECQILMLE